MIGGVVGNQFGSGTGRALATGAGAVGGAVAGNAIEARQKRDDEIYRVGVRLDNGARPSWTSTGSTTFASATVRIENGQLYRY